MPASGNGARCARSPGFTSPRLADRMAAFAEGARSLFLDSARAAIARAGLVPADIDCVVTLSSTGFTHASLEAQVAREIGFRSDIERVPVFGLGCAGGVSVSASPPGSPPPGPVPRAPRRHRALHARLSPRRADRRQSRRDRPVRRRRGGLRGAGGGGRRRGDRERRRTSFPRQPRHHGLEDRDDTGLGVVLAQSLPPFVRAELAPALDAILARAGLTPADIDRFVCHPAVRRFWRRSKRCCRSRRCLRRRAGVLADYGNMSSPTVLFVLERALAAGWDRAALLALGPGFTASCVTLRGVS